MLRLAYFCAAPLAIVALSCPAGVVEPQVDETQAVIIVHNEPLCREGFVEVPDRPGLGIELNPDVVKAHLAPGESWWE